MGLTGSQRKYLKKNLRKIPLSQIAENLSVTEKDLHRFLQSNWRKEKYERFLAEEKTRNVDKRALGHFSDWLKQNWIYLLILVFLVFAVYSNSLNNQFLSDDLPAIKDNPNLGQLSDAFSPRPPFVSLINLNNFLIYHLFGLQPAAYRLLNILFHSGSTLTVFVLIGFFFSFPINFFSAALFAVHPILTESVTWISGSHYSHSSLFVLLSFLFYLIWKRKEGKRDYFISLALFLVALLFSERAFILPLVLVWYEFCFTLAKGFSYFKKRLVKLIPFVVIAAFWGLILLGMVGGRVSSLQTTYYQEPGYNNPLIQIPVAITSYLELIFWPKNLAFYHSELNFTKLEYFLRLAIFLAFLGLIFLFYKKEKRISFWLFFPFILLSPTLTPLRIAWTVAERYAYLASLGIFIAFAWLIQRIGKKFKQPKIAYLVICLIIIALSARTVIRNRDWQNQDTLWLATARTSPSSHQNHNNLGDLYARHAEFEKAIEEFQIAIRLKPDYADAYHNLANVYHQVERDDLAEEYYLKALEFNPLLWQSHQNLASLYFLQNQPSSSLAQLLAAIEINPNNAELYTNLGITYQKLGQIQEAKKAIQKALSLDPQHQKAKQLLIEF